MRSYCRSQILSAFVFVLRNDVRVAKDEFSVDYTGERKRNFKWYIIATRLETYVRS